MSLGLLSKVKDDLRMSHDKLDEDVLDDISSCKDDLALAGVENITDDDPLIIRAVKLYCRWTHDFNGKGDMYQTYYERLKNSLSLSGKYK